MSTFREDGAATLEWVASYLERLRDFPVLSQVEPGDIRAALPTAPPQRAEPFAEILRDLDAVLLPGMTHWQSPRYFAYFATTASEPGILAELLIAGLNQIGILWRSSPALQELEEVSLDWLRQLVGLPEEMHGQIEEAASISTLTALAAARSARPQNRGRERGPRATRGSVAKASTIYPFPCIGVWAAPHWQSPMLSVGCHFLPAAIQFNTTVIGGPGSSGGRLRTNR